MFVSGFRLLRCLLALLLICCCARIATAQSNGAYPYAALIQAKDGNLYGTTFEGGVNNYGTVYQITTDGFLTTLHDFTGAADGAYPQGSLLQANDGNLYGTTQGGGSTNNYGTVFQISTVSGTLTTIYSFTGGGDGGDPYDELTQASDGDLYGTTGHGGTYGFGSVFKITLSGTLTNLYSFTGGSDGAFPTAGLIQAKDGNLYGMTWARGANMKGQGTVFKITLDGVLTTLYAFTGRNGTNPFDALMQAKDGKLYGTTWEGGTYYKRRVSSGYGTVFMITTTGVFRTLHSFSGGNDGGDPLCSLVQAKDRNLYGTSERGGANGSGTVFKISSKGVLTTLYSFSGGTDGNLPAAGLVQASDGNLYGTTIYGGANGNGTVFRISPSGTFVSLYAF